MTEPLDLETLRRAPREEFLKLANAYAALGTEPDSPERARRRAEAMDLGYEIGYGDEVFRSQISTRMLDPEPSSLEEWATRYWAIVEEARRLGFTESEREARQRYERIRAMVTDFDASGQRLRDLERQIEVNTQRALRRQDQIDAVGTGMKIGAIGSAARGGGCALIAALMAAAVGALAITVV